MRIGPRFTIIALVLLLGQPATAGPKASSKEGAMEAGSYMGVTEQCFAGPKHFLTDQALRFAAQAQKHSPRWYAIAYDAELKGPPADEAYCSDLLDRLYGKTGSASKLLGFAIWRDDVPSIDGRSRKPPANKAALPWPLLPIREARRS